MGVSGCGKTSLLNILSCRIIPKSGHIKANSETYNYDSFGNFGNYVMQQDYLMQTLTVRETLEFGANLRMTGDEHDITEKV
jgi:ABC-type multidrug transport system ATPase subunit